MKKTFIFIFGFCFLSFFPNFVIAETWLCSMEDTDKSLVSITLVEKNEEYFAFFEGANIPANKTYDGSKYIHFTLSVDEFAFTIVINKITNDAKASFFAMNKEYGSSLALGRCDKY